MKMLILCLSFLTIISTAFSESRTWTLKSGKKIEAEFIAALAKTVALKGIDGKNIKINVDNLSEEDVAFIEMEKPPELEISFEPNAKPRKYPQLAWGEPPDSTYYKFETIVKNKSNFPYNHPLTVEYFAITREVQGDKHILIDYMKADYIPGNSTKPFVLSSGRRIQVTEYDDGSRQAGRRYEGYVVIVTDKRGVIIAHDESNELFFTIHEKLRDIPRTRYFDDTGERVGPTRPKTNY